MTIFEELWTQFLNALPQFEQFLFERIVTIGFAAEIIIGMIALLFARQLSGRLLHQSTKGIDLIPSPAIRHRVSEAASSLAFPALFSLTLAVGQAIMVATGTGSWLISPVLALVLAWMVLRLIASIIDSPLVKRVVTPLVWGIAALEVAGVREPLFESLDSFGFPVGDNRISILTILEGAVAIAILMWFAHLAVRFSETQLKRSEMLTPSLEVLVGKVLRVFFYVIAIAVGLGAIGLDLTTLAVFSGAVGLGIGFGLQTIVSNLMSGIILLADQSVKPGDNIAVGDTYGQVNRMGARFVSIITRDGIEHLIPNEELVTNRVENWSYSSNQVRLKIPVGIAYDSDVRKAMEVCVDAATGVNRVLDRPEPVCRLMGFGASAIDLEIRLWIGDPEGGVNNVRSDVLLRVWDMFKEHGIEVPYDQQELHIKELPPVIVSSDGS